MTSNKWTALQMEVEDQNKPQHLTFTEALELRAFLNKWDDGTFYDEYCFDYFDIEPMV